MTTTYAIRQATSDDIDVLVGFTLAEARDAERRTLDVEGARRGVRAAFDSPPRATYWVAHNPEGRVVGSFSVVPEWSNFLGGDYWWIQSLYTSPNTAARAWSIRCSRICRRGPWPLARRSAALRLRHQRTRAAGVPAVRLRSDAVRGVDQAAARPMTGEPMPDTRLRAARLDDLPRILEIHNDAVLTTTAVFHYLPQTLETRVAWFEEKQAAGWPVIVVADAASDVTLGYGELRSLPRLAGLQIQRRALGLRAQGDARARSRASGGRGADRRSRRRRIPYR